MGYEIPPGSWSTWPYRHPYIHRHFHTSYVHAFIHPFIQASTMVLSTSEVLIEGLAQGPYTVTVGVQWATKSHLVAEVHGHTDIHTYIGTSIHHMYMHSYIHTCIVHTQCYIISGPGEVTGRLSSGTRTTEGGNESDSQRLRRWTGKNKSRIIEEKRRAVWTR